MPPEDEERLSVTKYKPDLEIVKGRTEIRMGASSFKALYTGAGCPAGGVRAFND